MDWQSYITNKSFEVISPNTDPDAIFVVVANVISHPGVFGFIMAALTAALMSTVDTLLNAIAAIYINDVHRPAKKWLSKKVLTWKEEDKQELLSARIATAIFTILGVLAVIPFSYFPTVYEAHGYFHSTSDSTTCSRNFLWNLLEKIYQHCRHLNFCWRCSIDGSGDVLSSSINSNICARY